MAVIKKIDTNSAGEDTKEEQPFSPASDTSTVALSVAVPQKSENGPSISSMHTHYRI